MTRETFRESFTYWLHLFVADSIVHELCIIAYTDFKIPQANTWNEYYSQIKYQLFTANDHCKWNISFPWLINAICH